MRWFRRTPLDSVRWVVIDCETSGLDMTRDRLLSVGAVAVCRGKVQLAEQFHALVGQREASPPENILIHGIGGDAQLSGRPLPAVIRELGDFIAGGVPVAFHAPFDAAVLRRHGVKPQQAWLDLATLAPALFPERRPTQSPLDQWLGEFTIAVDPRHDALCDAFATAQLLLVILAEAQRQSIETLEALQRASRGVRWLGVRRI